MSKNDKQNISSIGDILKRIDLQKDKYISREFQDYGYRLAEDLGDLKHKALYMKLAKEAPRHLLEEARNFVKDASNVKSRARLFMWKLKELKKDKKTKEQKNKGTMETKTERIEERQKN